MTLRLPLEYAAIEQILPHRYPFLLVDRVTEFEPDRRIVGIKNVSLNERFLWPKPDPYGFVFEVDAGGHVLRSLQDPGGQRVRHITSAEPWGSSLYLGSLDGPVAVWSPAKAP